MPSEEDTASSNVPPCTKLCDYNLQAPPVLVLKGEKIGWGYVWGLLEWILTRIHSAALPQVPQAPLSPLSPDAKDSTNVINRFPPETLKQ